ncbi:MAG: hypothetical protein OHK93_001361 [Ramalina farinacea]|uniref:GTP-binding protein EsdC n=1 Tax=Ramalina farinacea TaxID=258253 RepID=A0AA43QPA8_9LECA|nr:hypothetical protein [Ramalina farinacea]
MSSTQLSFTLSTSSKVKTAHLLGSWDNYSGQLPLSKASTAGKWKGTFRFGNSTLKPGSRYWYYYIIDGYHVSHDPSVSATKEPTTGRMLNILDVPKSASTSSKRASAEIPKGRGLSPSRIVCPKPSKPYASRAVREADYSMGPGMEDIAEKLEQASLYDMRHASPPSSVGSSLSSRSSGSDRSSPSSLSSLSSSSGCSCNRYGVTRRGDRVKLDCGGSRCGSDSSESDSEMSESESESESEDERPVRRSSSSSKSKARYVEVRPRQAVRSSHRR